MSHHLIGNQHAKGNKPNSTSFKKGAVPWNKGLTGYMGPNATSFKPGVPNGRAVPVGTIRLRVRKRGGEKPRQFIKTSKGWVPYAEYLWIERYGRLINGDTVHHINGDSVDDRIENLLAVPRALHPTLHNKHWLIQPSPELLQACLERYKLP